MEQFSVNLGPAVIYVQVASYAPCKYMPGKAVRRAVLLSGGAQFS